jgi:hypothetical protein
MEERPGLGWASTARRVALHPMTILIDSEFGRFPGNGVAAAELVNLALPGAMMSAEILAEATMKALTGFFDSSPMLAEELEEFLTLRTSNERILRWNIMKIAPNASFRLHAHQNIELICVLEGAMNEVRLVSDPPQRAFPPDQKDGPNLTNPNLELHFERRTTHAPTKPLSACTVDDLQPSFLINPKGSIHLSYTSEEGANLLVLWSGTHGNIPAHEYPPDSESVFALPDTIVPF